MKQRASDFNNECFINLIFGLSGQFFVEEDISYEEFGKMGSVGGSSFVDY